MFTVYFILNIHLETVVKRSTSQKFYKSKGPQVKRATSQKVPSQKVYKYFKVQREERNKNIGTCNMEHIGTPSKCISMGVSIYPMFLLSTVYDSTL